MERNQRRFGQFLFSFRWNRPTIFGKFGRKSSKQLHTIQNDEDHVSEKMKSCFYKYSISQDIPKEGSKEPKYQMQPSKTSAGKSQHCSRTKIGIISRTIISRSSQNTFSFTTKETSQAQLKAETLGLPQRHFKRNVNWFWWHWPTFFKDLYRNLQKECTQSKTTKTTFPKNEEQFFQQLVLYISITRLKTHYQTKLSTTSAAQTWLCIWTKGRIVSSRETSESSKNLLFWLQPKKKAKQSSNRHFWNVLYVNLESWCLLFGEIAHYFSGSLYENHQNICIQYKTTKTTFPEKPKLFFLSFRYGKTSQTQDVKSQSTKRSVRKKAQPKSDSAFEQKTRIVPCREISASSQNSFFIYIQRIKPTRAQKDIFGTYSTSFRKVSVFLKKQKLFS